LIGQPRLQRQHHLLILKPTGVSSGRKSMPEKNTATALVMEIKKIDASV